MQLEILSKEENVLLERTEIRFKIAHDQAKTPTRKEVREAISSQLGEPKEKILVNNMDSKFGIAVTIGYAKIYANKKTAQKIERESVLKRNGLFEKKKKEGEDKGE